MRENNALWEFPCRFPLKIIGERHEDFVTSVILIVQAHAPDFNENELVVRDSRQGRYVSLTATINATSRAQLDRLYLALTRHAMVKVVL